MWFSFFITWEQRKFGEYFEERNERSGEGELISVTINSGIKKFNELGRFDTKPEDLSKYKRVDVGDIAYNSMRMWQGASGYSPYSGILSPAYTVISPRTGVSSMFFAYLIKRPQMIHLFEINSQGLTSDTWNLKFPAFSQIEASAPTDIAEQKNIAEIFTVLDNLITLHQRKQNELFLLILGKKTSSILANDWEQCKFAEVYSFASEGGTPDTNTAAYYRNGTIPFVRIEDTENKYIDSVKTFVTEEGLKHSSAWLIPSGSVIFTNGATVGNVAINRIPVATKQGILGIIPHKTVMAEYLYYLLSSGFFQREVRNRQATGTFATIILKNLNEINVFVPDKAEQQKISGYLSSIDNLITLHQCKENLGQNEYGLLSSLQMKHKMANDWEQRKLGDIGRVAMNRRIFKEQTSDEGSVPFYKIGTFGGEPDAFISDELYQEYKALFPYPKIGDILLSASGSIGKMVEYKGEKAYFQDSNIVWLDHDASVSNSFLKCFYSVVKWAGLEGSTIKRLYNKNILETKIALPSYAEQVLIGDFFEGIDNLITLHQCKREAFLSRKSPAFFQFNKGRNTLTWEQCKLGDIAIEVNRTDANSNAPIMMITANDGFIEQSERYAFNNAGESLKRYIVLHKGELAYNHGASKLRPYGSCFALINQEKARIPFVYHCFSVENHNSEFVSIELNGNDVESQLRRIVSSGARMDGLLNISFQDYASISILLPEKAEQDKIARVFRNLDNLITLHQRGEKIYNRRQT